MPDPGFPVVQKTAPASSTALTGNENATITVGPFSPDLGRAVYTEIIGDGFTGTIQILRSKDGGTTKELMTKSGSPIFNINLSEATTAVIVNEIIDTPLSATLTYYIAITVTAGSLKWSLYQ